MKRKQVYVCSSCGAQYPKWEGRCSSCGEWNSLEEQIVEASPASSKLIPRNAMKPLRLSEVSATDGGRIDTGDAEFNRVLGGGLVPGSITLLGGEPGIGKSTLVLQFALHSKLQVLYLSGEESVAQIKMRAERLGITHDNTLFISGNSLEQLLEQLDVIQPQVLIVDSIQTLATETVDAIPGSLSQIRECTNSLLRYTKERGMATILIGHITKEGQLAGPKILEHVVDTVLQFEGDQQHLYRILRAMKNRFGSTSEIGIYEMLQDGLRQVNNPSELLLSAHDEPLSGIAVAATIEGIRPILLEIQALVSTAAYGTPQRSSTGFDGRRLNMLLAVLEKRVGFKLAVKDVFINVAGGIRVSDPALDLAVVVAVLSSSLDLPLSLDAAFVGEIGLSGEIRSVSRIEQRIAEAEKLGFKKIYIPAGNRRAKAATTIKVVPVNRLTVIARELFSGK